MNATQSTNQSAAEKIAARARAQKEAIVAKASHRLQAPSVATVTMTPITKAEEEQVTREEAEATQAFIANSTTGAAQEAANKAAEVYANAVGPGSNPKASSIAHLSGPGTHRRVGQISQLQMIKLREMTLAGESMAAIAEALGRPAGPSIARAMVHVHQGEKGVVSVEKEVLVTLDPYENLQKHLVSLGNNRSAILMVPQDLTAKEFARTLRVLGVLVEFDEEDGV
jgi:NADH dehydrogenase FAD-containing subunit